MKSLRQSLAFAALFSGLSVLSSGCGGDQGDSGPSIDAPPDMTAKPDMSKMPGFDDMQKKLKDEGKVP